MGNPKRYLINNAGVDGLDNARVGSNFFGNDVGVVSEPGTYSWTLNVGGIIGYQNAGSI